MISMNSIKFSNSSSSTDVGLTVSSSDEDDSSPSNLLRRRAHPHAKSRSCGPPTVATSSAEDVRKPKEVNRRSQPAHLLVPTKEVNERKRKRAYTKETNSKSSSSRGRVRSASSRQQPVVTAKNVKKNDAEEDSSLFYLFDSTEDSKGLFYLACGVVLLLIGIVGTIIQLLLYLPYLVCCIVGICSLAAYLWTVVRKLGIVRLLLPPHARRHAERVLSGSLFDFLYFDSGVTEVFRKWARFILLTMDLTEPEIAEVSKGMSPKFLEQVLFTQIIDNLPSSVRTIIGGTRTEDTESEEDRDECVVEKKIYFDADNPSMWNQNSIINLLCEKKRIKEAHVIAEPPLRSATQLIITNRVSAPLSQLTLTVVNAGSWLMGLMSLVPLYVPAMALVENKTDIWKFLKILGTNTKIQVCLLATASFTLVSYQLRKRYQWLAERSGN